MKKLARLTALLLTGVMLLLLASCGAAPLTPEQQAKKQIFDALNEYRASNGAKAVKEIPELSKAEQYWVDAFHKAGDYKMPRKDYIPVMEERQKLIPAEWYSGSGLGWEYDSATYDYVLLEDTDPSDTAALMKQFATVRDFRSDSCTAVGIGVTTIKGKIYWACTMYGPKT